VVGTALLIILLAVLLLTIRRRRRRVTVPRPASTVPSIESPDGAVYFRLDGLNEDGLIIGRGKHGVDLRIDEAVLHANTVSNRHARIYYDPTYGRVVIEDLDSTNGVFINGRQAPRKNLLRDGWSIGLGQLTLIYHDGESDTGPLD
jgi:pSer/pThr/pTyr-binding forkhead associated (FHA) protein